MKFLTVILFFLPIISSGQTEQIKVVQPKHEIGFNLFSMTNFDPISFPGKENLLSADFNYFTGIFYKYHSGKNAMRTSFDLSQKAVNINTNPNLSYYYSENSNRTFIGLKIGYERYFGNKKIQPFAFSDLLFNYDKRIGVRSSIGCFGWDINVPFESEDYEYGLDLGGGMRYLISRNIVLTYEFNVQGVFIEHNDLLHPGNRWYDIGFHLNPVNKLGFAIMF